MDVTVTRAAYCRNAWTLMDLLGRPMRRIMEARGPGFTIYPAERAHHVMGEIPFGPFASLDDALRALEKRTHGVCRRPWWRRLAG